MADLSSVGFSGNDGDDVDVESLRTRLRKMNDQELRRFGLAAKVMCSPGANLGKPPAPNIRDSVARGKERNGIGARHSHKKPCSSSLL